MKLSWLIMRSGLRVGSRGGGGRGVLKNTVVLQHLGNLLRRPSYIPDEETLYFFKPQHASAYKVRRLSELKVLL